MPRAPYSFTLRNTLYPEGLGLKAATPWWVMSASQYDSSPGAATIGVSAASSVKELKAGLPLSASDNCALMAVKSSQEAVTRKPCMLYTTIARPKDLENSCHTARAVRHFYIHQTPSHNKHPRHSGKRNSCSCSHILQPVQPQMATVDGDEASRPNRNKIHTAHLHEINMEEGNTSSSGSSSIYSIPGTSWIADVLK